MKVENPRFNATSVECEDCPCNEESTPDLVGTGICCSFRGSDGRSCPTAETYAEACTLAEATMREVQQ